MKCSKCKLQKNEFLYERCDCGGDYIKTFEENIFKNMKSMKNITEFLTLINQIASHYDLKNLRSQLTDLIN